MSLTTTTSTTTTTKKDDETNEDSSNDLTVVIIVSATAGILVGLGVSVGAGYFFCYRKLKKVTPTDAANIEMK